MPRVIHSSAGQIAAATAVASVVAVKALAAIPSAASALPALKPYQPTQSMPVPTVVSTTLCGRKACRANPRRRPRIRQSTRADQPDDMWTTVPPAKSIALMAAVGLPRPFISPSMPQIMCASGK